ncbi:putative Elongator-like Protein 3a [Leptomonas pyrrhocoris]|uniref:tRNA carboxymethyluridine synthase n=1 Tax=Leptomonas pyrrhocoris TaxID=157538 RepID=A0A0N0DTP6_LEPPY|nr:putative Elongator-like Protein 3a [Leptomonas pyrrhocoris]KPA77792.1 putative Elongator-like Protein 3a [Leptomonas pyrrhocoris]|eukprot:XP_015656231.1 putative Elongator-like Protein 3a [Leptomonas pyrrhocoris]
MSSDSDDEDSPMLRQAHASVDWSRVNHKLANLPTLEKLLREKNPNAHSPQAVEEASHFVRDLIAMNPQSDTDVERAQRRLQKKYHKVFKKSLLLAGYKHLVYTAAALAADEATSDQTSSPVLKDMEDTVTTASLGPSPSSPSPSAATATPPSSPTSLAALVCPVLERYLVSKAPRSQSGVLVVTVFTSPYPDGQTFSCQWNCYYCPNEPGQPRSYLLNEPGVRRANRLEFDPCRQFEDRVHSLMAIGHPADKVELLVLGGTWESYPFAYRERFIRDLFYAANILFDPPLVPRRPPLDMLQEQLMNESARCKIIGVTLETRPDTINSAMLVELRRFGCTRVQLGIQHTDDGILTLVNRQSTREDAASAIKLLKDSCFKVDIHLMPDLPGASPDIDKAMFDDVLNSPYLQADQWKIYPCQTTPFSVIEQWFKEGKYHPYGLESLIDVLLYAKVRVHPWIRINRVIRDIPVDYVLAGVEVTNLRQLLAAKLKERGERCRCIRCREVKGDKHVSEKLKCAVVRERTYEASEGTEVFLSVEAPTEDETVFGFLRLRLHIRHWDTPFAELSTCALIRELHVYGHLLPAYTATNGSCDAVTTAAAPAAQHTGIGRRLLERAEAIATAAGYANIAVISGVGVRGYYRRHGYRLMAAHRGGFLIKSLPGENGTAAASLSSPVSATSASPTASTFSLSRDADLIHRLTLKRNDAQRVGASLTMAATVARAGVALRTHALDLYCQVRRRAVTWWAGRKRSRGEDASSVEEG